MNFFYKYYVPKYRLQEFKKTYKVFLDKCTLYDLQDRKLELKNIMKLKYPWLNNTEYNLMYNTIKNNEINLLFEKKKSIISNKYKNKIIELFNIFDSNNDNCINFLEFKSIIIELNLYTENEIINLFNKFDLNNDNILSINEFIEFITINENIIPLLDNIINYKFTIKKKNDKRTLIFKDFPGSPLKKSWRPALVNLNSLENIKNNMINFK